ncbi:MAG: glutathione S-transferase family protein [Chromatiales bacterium]|jgi:glutathione S-transferase|nr:glutathione S-transferase family protein [Chromatiales bacterium]
MLTVWGRANSVNVMKVLWTCEELGAPFERREAGLEHGRVDTPEFLDMNPNGRVPVINDDGFCLWESNAIVRYLSYKYGLGSFYPSDVRRRAEAEQWMEWQQTTVAPIIAWPFQGLIRKHPDYQNEAKLAEASAELDKVWSVLDRHLLDQPFVLGQSLTMADIPLGAAVWRWSNLPIERASMRNVEAWLERLKARPGFAQYVAQSLT